MHRTRLTALSNIVTSLAIASLLAGCATAWNVGDDKFSCPGMVSGVICKTPLEVYKATQNRNALVTMDGNGKKAVVDAGGDDGVAAGPAAMQVHLPTPIEQPLPVMEAAQVIRIWIAPWIDQAGDLHYPSFVFSEVTPRRWSFGNLVKGQGARVPVAAFIDADRDEAAGAPKSNVLPMGPAGIAPPLSDKKLGTDPGTAAKRPGTTSNGGAGNSGLNSAVTNVLKQSN